MSSQELSLTASMPSHKPAPGGLYERRMFGGLVSTRVSKLASLLPNPTQLQHSQTAVSWLVGVELLLCVLELGYMLGIADTPAMETASVTAPRGNQSVLGVPRQTSRQFSPYLQLLEGLVCLSALYAVRSAVVTGSSLVPSPHWLLVYLLYNVFDTGYMLFGYFVERFDPAFYREWRDAPVGELERRAIEVEFTNKAVSKGGLDLDSREYSIKLEFSHARSNHPPVLGRLPLPITGRDCMVECVLGLLVTYPSPTHPPTEAPCPRSTRQRKFQLQPS